MKTPSLKSLNSQSCPSRFVSLSELSSGPSCLALLATFSYKIHLVLERLNLWRLMPRWWQLQLHEFHACMIQFQCIEKLGLVRLTFFFWKQGHRQLEAILQFISLFLHRIRLLSWFFPWLLHSLWLFEGEADGIRVLRWLQDWILLVFWLVDLRSCVDQSTTVVCDRWVAWY